MAGGRRTLDQFAGRSFFTIALAPIVLVAFMIVMLALRARPILAAHPLGDLLLGETWLPDDDDHRHSHLCVVRVVPL
jgi:ABC-type phosphate transport system permease subunit